jgi:hypothetical protein
MDEFDESLQALEVHLEPFFKLQWDELLPHLTMEETAQLKMTIAFALNSFYYSLFGFSGALKF